MMPEPRNPLEVVEEALDELRFELTSYYNGHVERDIETEVVLASSRAALTLLRKLRADAVVVRIVAEVASTGASDDVWEMRVIVPDGEHEDEGDEVALFIPFTDSTEADDE